MKKNIIFIVNRLGGGGAERVVSVLANKFSNNGFNVKIIVFNDSSNNYKIEEKIEYIKLEVNKGNKILNLIKKITLLRKEVKKSKDSCIIAFEYFINMYTIVATLFLRNKVIISERNDPARLENRKIMKYARDFLYRFADRIVFQTHDAKNYFSKEIQDKSVIIMNPIMKNLPEKFIGNRKKNIVTFCRLEEQKNLKLMIDVFKLISEEYRDYTLTIYGEGSLEVALRNQIKELNLEEKVKINPFSNNIHKLIVDSAMYLSTSNYEGLSNAMLEAMSIGLPVVVTDCPCGGARMVIKDGINGVLVKVKDIDSIYNGIKRVIIDDKFSEKISDNGSKIKYILDEDKIFYKWLEII